MKKIHIASDHAAFKEKMAIIKHYQDKYDFIDLGPSSDQSVSYSDYGLKLAKEVKSSNGLGIALCGSGIGISMAVNRIEGIRGALCRDIEDAKMSRLHNDSNIICVGARRNTLLEIIAMIDMWINTSFEGGRHQVRIDGLDKL